jgi:hypothetical protein
MQVLALSAIKILALKPFYSGPSKKSKNDGQLELNRSLFFQILIPRNSQTPLFY